MASSDLDRLRRLRQRLDAVLEEETTADQFDPASGERPGSWVPAVDILESEAEYRILAELPGVRREDVELRLVDDRLELFGKRPAPSDVGRFHRMEGRYGPFHRIVNLGDDADSAGITARLVGGVLSVRVAKRGGRRGRRRISVNWGEGDA